MVTLVVFIKNKTMKNFKLLVIGLLVGCFPSFEPKNVLKKEIEEGDIEVKWISLVGILDQDFPDYILFKKNKSIDTICEAHNIKDFTLKNNTITIKFLGTPKKYNYPIEIPEHIYEYNIKVDTIN
jgi:hypothetical protein